MRNFKLSLSTEIYFGKGQIANLGGLVRQYGSKILLVIGGRSVKRYGIFDEVISQIKDINYIEFSGVESNPRLETVRKGIEICKQEDIDFILAVGGGSVIDAGKAIALGSLLEVSPRNEDIWEYFLTGKNIDKALPIGVVLTISATGSEMNGNCVITNWETRQKYAIHSEVLKPKFSILDPKYTFTVSKKHTAAGIADITSHILEQYFSSTKTAYITDRVSEAVLKTVFFWGPIAYEEPENYEARANIMWAGTIALNELLGCGKVSDWATHIMEHGLSAYYDISHGIGLAILTPYWMEYVLDESTLWKFVEYGRNMFGIDEAKEAIKRTREFFNRLGLPSKLREVNIDDKYFKEMCEDINNRFGEIGNFKKLSKKDIYNIYKMALKM